MYMHMHTVHDKGVVSREYSEMWFGVRQYVGRYNILLRFLLLKALGGLYVLEVSGDLVTCPRLCVWPADSPAAPVALLCYGCM